VKSVIIKNNLNPVWDQRFELSFAVGSSAVEEPPRLQLQSWDWDLVGKDEFLGCAEVPLDHLVDSQTTTAQVTLEQVLTGRIHLKQTLRFRLTEFV
jgi:Ca2+-dependent lipid-binding protein